MGVVLRAKFREGTILAQALIATGADFLLQYDEGIDGRRNCNELGVQLMLIRDELRKQVAFSTFGYEFYWGDFLSKYIDLDTGQARSAKDGEFWQSVVYDATAAL